MNDKINAIYRLHEGYSLDYKRRRQAIQGDDKLSARGKGEALKQLKTEYDSKLKELEAQFKDETDDWYEDLKKRREGKPKQTMIERIKETLSTPSVLDTMLTSDMQVLALIEVVERFESALAKSNYMNLIGKMDERGFNSAYLRAKENSNVTELEWLSEIATMTGDTHRAELLSKAREMAMEAHYTPEQKAAKQKMEEIDLERAKFVQTMNAARERDGSIIITEGPGREAVVRHYKDEEWPEESAAKQAERYKQIEEAKANVNEQ